MIQIFYYDTAIARAVYCAARNGGLRIEEVGYIHDAGVLVIAVNDILVGEWDMDDEAVDHAIFPIWDKSPLLKCVDAPLARRTLIKKDALKVILCLQRFFGNQCNVDQAMTSDTDGWQMTSVDHSTNGFLGETCQLGKQLLSDNWPSIHRCRRVDN